MIQNVRVCVAVTHLLWLKVVFGIDLNSIKSNRSQFLRSAPYTGIAFINVNEIAAFTVSTYWID